MTAPEPVPTTWERTHAGDIVLGHDGLHYGVAEIALGDPRGPVVSLTRHGDRTTAQPPPETPITVVSPVDTSAEARAFAVLFEAGLDPVVIRESYQP